MKYNSKSISKPASYTSGNVYGYLTLTGKSFLVRSIRYVEYICECGKIGYSQFHSIKIGTTKSCGCKRIELQKKCVIKHGMTSDGKNHPIWAAWRSMRQRCRGTLPSYKKNYFDRGIKVCKEWKNSFDCFYQWAIKNGWEIGLSLERVNNNGNYSPNNCVWATMATQSRNTRQNVYVEAFGERKCMRDWGNDKRCVVHEDTIRYRINIKGWSPEAAITTKPK